MKSIIPVHHYHLRMRKEGDKHVPAVTNHATIAHEALEAAKGGHVIVLHLRGASQVIEVQPDDDLGELTTKVQNALNPPAPPAAEPSPEPAPDTASDPEATPSRRSRKGASHHGEPD